MPEPTTHRNQQTHLTVALLIAINLFNYIDRYILAAVVPLISKDFFSATDDSALAKTGSLATAFLVSYMVLAPLFGWLADRFSRWLIIAFGVTLWSLASGGSGWAGTFTSLLVMRILVGVGEAAYGPAAPTIISDLFPAEKRGRMMAFFYAAIPVGSAIGYAFGGKASSFNAHLGWRLPFYLVTIPGMLLGGLCLFMRDPRGSRARGAAGPSQPKVTLRDALALFRIRSFTMNTAAMTAMTFAMGGISFWVPHYFYVTRAQDFGGHPDLGQITFTFGALTAAAGLLATIIGGWTGDFVRRRMPSAYFVVSAITIFFAFPATLLMLRMPFPTAWVLVFFVVFFLFFNTGPANAALANVTPPHVRSTAFALNILILHLGGDAISPPLIGWIAERTGPPGNPNMDFAFKVVSAMMVVAAACWLMGARSLARDTAAITALEEEHPTPDIQHPGASGEHPTPDQEKHPTSNTQHPTSNG